MENTMVKTPTKKLLLRALCVVLAVVIFLAVLAALSPVFEPKYLTQSKEGSLTEE